MHACARPPLRCSTPTLTQTTPPFCPPTTPGSDAELAAAIRGLLGPILRGPAASTRHLCGPVTAAGLSLLASERLTGTQLAATSSEWMPALVRSLRGPAPRPTEAVTAALGAAKALLSRDCAAVLASLAPGGDAAGVTIPHYCFPGVWETVASCDDVAAATTLLAAAAELQAGSAAARGPGGGAAQAQPVPGARPFDDSMLGGFIATQGLSSTLARQLDGARQDAARFARFAPGVVASRPATVVCVCGKGRHRLGVGVGVASGAATVTWEAIPGVPRHRGSFSQGRPSAAHGDSLPK